MPSFKLVPTLSQVSVDALTKLIIHAIDPEKHKTVILNYLISKGKVSENKEIHINNSLLEQNEENSLEMVIRKQGNNVSDNDLSTTTLKEDELQEDITSIIGNEENKDFLGIMKREIDIESYINSESYLFESENVFQYVKALAKELTSHSHCGLHELLFWTILPKLNNLYSKYGNKEMRKLIRLIVPWFINPCVKVFNFCSFKMFTESTMFQAVYAQLKKATGLEKLIFGRSCYWRSKCINNLGSILHEMENLKVLHIHYICRPEMLINLSRNCPCLMELSLKGSQDVTDNEIPSLMEFPNLHTLDISGTSITGNGCRILINSLPNLIWLTHCPFNCNSDTLIFESREELFKYIKHQLKLQNPLAQLSVETEVNTENQRPEMISEVAQKYDIQDDFSGKEIKTENKLFSLNLKSFWLFNTTTEELLLTLLCPHLEQLRLDFVIQDLEEEPDTSAISKISNLSSLFLYMYDRCPARLVTSIIELGSSLTYLHLHLGDEWFFVAPMLNMVARCCSNLTVLIMEGDYKGQHILEDGDSRLDFSLPAEGLKHLIEAKVSGCVSDLRLLHLLIQAPNLQVLHLDGELEWLHDETFSEAVKSRLLLQLQELWFNVSTGVTLASVRRLLQSENKLQKVGRLCLMAAATKDIYQELLHYVKRNNLSTELIWVTDQRDIKFKSAVSSD